MSDYIRLTGMFKSKDNKRNSSATPNAEALKRLVQDARAALADDKLLKFSFWDNENKPNKWGKVGDSLSYTEVDGKKERDFAAAQKGRPAYKPKPQEIPPEAPMEEPKVNFQAEDNW